MAPRDGFEPPTNGLTVRRSTTELPGNSEEARIVGKPRTEVKESGISVAACEILQGAADDFLGGDPYGRRIGVVRNAECCAVQAQLGAFNAHSA